ncbi:transcriptional repressor [Litorivicinus lipolyticus]|nr:transcriptional repressor [Litorivicinus lipolyticus]
MPQSESPSFERHDHNHCIASTVGMVATACADQGLQLTPVRKRVLELLLDQHRALGAYELLDGLRADGLGSQPPAVYRALEFLVSHGFAHKIERLNAFIACGFAATRHSPAFLICRGCHAIAEADSDGISAAIEKTARDCGFVTEQRVVEIEGLCPRCVTEQPA